MWRIKKWKTRSCQPRVMGFNPAMARGVACKLVRKQVGLIRKWIRMARLIGPFVRVTRDRWRSTSDSHLETYKGHKEEMEHRVLTQNCCIVGITGTCGAAHSSGVRWWMGKQGKLFHFSCVKFKCVKLVCGTGSRPAENWQVWIRGTYIYHIPWEKMEQDSLGVVLLGGG